MPQRTQPRFRPSDLLPWADPHIRSLVEQLQQEVRDENAALRSAPAPEGDRWSSLGGRIGADEALGA